MMPLTRFLFAAIASLSLTHLSAGQTLRLEQTSDTIVVREDGRDVLTYHKRSPPVPADIDPVYRRSGFLHPVRSPQGRSVTAVFPFDHPHQQGVFSAWVKTTYDDQSVDFWNSASETGRVLHERVVREFEQPDSAGFEVDLVHRALTTPPVDILRERWRVTVRASDDGVNRFDLETEQTALTDKPLVVHKHHYGGLAVRGPTDWLRPEDRSLGGNDDPVSSPSGFLNDLGSNREEGNHQHARWVAMWGEIDGQPLSVTVLSHTDNFRAPQAARLHPTKPYFCFAPCVDDAFVIDSQHPYVSKYRFLISDTMPDADRIDQQWDAWCR